MRISTRELYRKLQEEAGESGDTGAGAAPVVESVSVTPDTNAFAEVAESFDEFDENRFGDLASAEEVPVESEVPVAPQVEQPQTSPAPVTEQVPVTPPVAPVETPQPTTPPEQPQAPQDTAPEFDPVAFQQKYAETLTKSYQLTDEEREQYNLDPATTLPALAANLHQRVMNEVLTVITAALPAQIQRYTQGEARERTAKEQFYSKWPELRNYEAQVLQAGQIYNKMAPPNATPEQRIEGIGRMVAAALNLPLETRNQTPAQQQVVQQAVQAAVPYVPAGASVTGNSRGAPQNPFGDLAIELDD
jgi:hypothetical protein